MSNTEEYAYIIEKSIKLINRIGSMHCEMPYLLERVEIVERTLSIFDDLEFRAIERLSILVDDTNEEINTEFLEYEFLEAQAIEPIGMLGNIVNIISYVIVRIFFDNHSRVQPVTEEPINLDVPIAGIVDGNYNLTASTNSQDYYPRAFITNDWASGSHLGGF